MSKIIPSADITLLDFSALLDLSTSPPTAIVTNMSTVVNVANLQWVFEFYSPSDTPIYVGDFSAPDVDGVSFTSFDLTASNPIPQVMRQIEFSKLNQYTVEVFVKDDAGDTYSLKKGFTPLCKPNGNNGKNNFGAATIDIEVKCGTGQLYVTDKSNLVYNSITGDQVSTSVELTYPKDTNGNTLAPVTVTSIPVLLPIKYEGEGHEIYVAHIYDYDMGDYMTVRIRYYYSKIFPVWCNITLQPLFCEIDKLTDFIQKNCSSHDSADDREKQRTLSLVTAKMLKAHTGIVQPLSGFDVPGIVEEVKELLGVECDCCRPAGISNVGTVLLTDAVLTVNKVCGDMLLSWTNDGMGNIVLNYQNYTYVFAMSADADSSEAFEWQSSQTGCVKTRTLFVDRAVLAEEIVTEIQNNSTLIAILNDVLQKAAFSCTGLDGMDIIDFSLCDYTVLLNARVTGTLMGAVIINGTTYLAPSDTLLSDAAAIQSWLNTLTLGTFVVTYDGGTLKTTISTAANENTLSTALTYTPGNVLPKVTAFASSCGLLCTIMQKFVSYLASLNMVQIYSGQELSICRFNPDGTVLTKVFDADAKASEVALYMADSFCNILNYMKTRLLTCDNIKSTFAAFTGATGNPDGADIIFGLRNGNCQQYPLKNIAIGIFTLLRTDVDVKDAYCQVSPCTTVNDCDAVTNLAASVSDTSASYSWTAVVGAIGYKWSIDGINYFTVSSTFANITGLTASTTYTFRVYPVYVSGDGIDCEITDDFATTGGTTCATPGSLVLDNITDTSFRATWAAVTDATGYQYSLNGGSWVNIGNVLTFSPSGLTQDTDYNFQVRAIVGGNPCTANVATDDVTTEITINYRLSASYGMSIDSVTGTGVPSPALPSTGVNGTEEGYHTTMTGALSVVLTGATLADTFLFLIKNGSDVDSIDVSAGPGTYALAAPGATILDFVEITLVNNA